MIGKRRVITAWVGLLILIGVGGVSAELKKDRLDLTGKKQLSTEQIIAGLTPRPEVRTRGLSAKTRGLQPGLATIALTVRFAFDSADVLPDTKPMLANLGRALQSPQLAPYRIRIEGHTDSVGGAAYNLGLSTRRAESVKRYLTQHFDIEPERLVTIGRGEQEPLTSNGTSEGRRKNRRAEFVNLGRR